MAHAISRWASCLVLIVLQAVRVQATNGATPLAPGNGIWLRSETTIPGNEAAIVANLQARALKHIFIFTVGKSSSAYATYGKFLQTAHSSGMTVHAICASNSNVETNEVLYPSALQYAIDQVVAYNSTTNTASKFDGVQMDVEGHVGSDLLALLRGVSVPASLYFSAAVQADELNTTEYAYSNMVATTSLDMLVPMIYILDDLGYSGGNLTWGYNLCDPSQISVSISNKTREILARLPPLPSAARVMTGLSCYDYEAAVTMGGKANWTPTGGWWGSQMAFSGGRYSVPYLAARWPLVSVTYQPFTGISSYRFNYGGTNWWDIHEMTPVGVGLSLAAANAGGRNDPRYVGAAVFLYSTIFDSTSTRQWGLTLTDPSTPSPQVSVQIVSLTNHTARLRVSLVNGNPAEQILGDAASSGVHLQLPPGAWFASADPGAFHAALGFDSSGSQLGSVSGAQVLELRRYFFENLSAQSAQSGDIYITALVPFALQYRAWMTAKTSLYTNNGVVAPYIVRSPEDLPYQDASRFMSYALFTTNVTMDASGSYVGAVGEDSPLFYARFSERGIVTTPRPFSAANLGTVGAAGTGTCLLTNNGVSTTTLGQQPGVLGGPTNTAFAFCRVPTNPVVVPYCPQWNLNGPFSVELWLKGGTTFSCPASSVQYNQAGWLLYQQDANQANGNGWCFRVYNNNATNPRVDAKVAMTVNPSAWYHVVGVYNGANALLYVNGALAASTVLGSGYVYVPNASATNLLTWGARSGLYAWPYGGVMGEAAFYTNALSAGQIAAHYAAATTNAAGYPAMVLSLKPAGYWRFNDALNPPVATNSGTGGGALNGAYLDWSTTLADLQAPAFPGLESTNTVAEWFGTNGQVLVPPLNLNTNTVTFECWLKRCGTQASDTGLLMHRNPDNSGACGLGFHGDSNHLGYWWNDAATTYNWDSGLQPPEGRWTYAALTISPTQAVICMCDGTTWSTATNSVSHTPQPFAGLTRLGSDGALGGRWFNGSLDEAAIYSSALSQAQLRRHALAAFGNTNQPLFTQLPVSQTVPCGAPATFSAAAVGAPAIEYQWQRNGANLPGATNPTLTLASVDYTNAGQYAVTAANLYGSVFSPAVTLTVTPPAGLTHLTYRISTTDSGPTLGLIWPAGVLYCATNLLGPWSVVSEALPPYYEAPITQTARTLFFQVQ